MMWLPVVTLIRVQVSENANVFKTNQKKKKIKKHGSVGQNIDPKKVFVFTSPKVLSFAYKLKATPKYCLELKTLLLLAPKFQMIASAT